MMLNSNTKLRNTRFRPRLLSALLISSAALLSLLWSWTRPEFDVVSWLNPRSSLVALFLVTMVILADAFPIQIRPHVKASLSTVPLYLIAVFLPPSVAGFSSGFAVFVSEVLTRRERGYSLFDIMIATARWVIVALLGSLVAHLPALYHTTQAVVLVEAALVMFVSEILLSSFEIAPMSGEAVSQVVLAAVREAGLLEGVQYILGLLGAMAAFQHIWALLLLVLPGVIVYSAFKNAKEVRKGTREILELMADTVDLRDPYTGGHSRRVAKMASQILQELGILHGPERELIELAARVHDIGKIGLPDSILKKTGKLTPEEWLTLMSHTQRGADLLARYPDFARGAAIVGYHHERWDGRGYPHHLRGADIPVGARVIAVADSFDAMTSDRPYRHAISVQNAAMILWEGRGRQWDAVVVDAFLRTIAEELPADFLARAQVESQPQAELEEMGARA